MARDGRVPIVVVDSRAGGLDVECTLSADEYLEGREESLAEGQIIVNLCRSYQYLSKGYYVSLLADARNQRVFPTLEMIEEVNNPFAYFRRLRETGVDTIEFKVVRGRRVLPKVIVPRSDEAAGPCENGEAMATREENDGQIRYEPVAERYVETTSIFGRPADDRFRRAAAAIFRVYAFPILRIRFYGHEGAWKVGQIFPAPLGELGEDERTALADALSTGKFSGRVGTPSPRPHRIACLWDPEDRLAPSDGETLDKFARVAARQGLLFERIGRQDLSRLAEYDALFIRTVTAIDHYSFGFAQSAESLGIPVIDDPQSILRCSNKVYLHELFRKNGIPTPSTTIVSRRTPIEEIEALGFPLIVKLPDGTFSHSVKKVPDGAELKATLKEMLRNSALVIVQEFTPTAFDWRIGVLDGEVLYTCRYHMVKDHWQIVRRFESGFTRFGRVEAVRLADVPDEVLRVALGAAELIGNGLYGVDVKEAPSGSVVIEVNDNPNIEVGCEDAVEKDRLYEQIFATFMRRIQDGVRLVGQR